MRNRAWTNSVLDVCVKKKTLDSVGVQTACSMCARVRAKNKTNGLSLDLRKKWTAVGTHTGIRARARGRKTVCICEETEINRQFLLNNNSLLAQIEEIRLVRGDINHNEIL